MLGHGTGFADRSKHGHIEAADHLSAHIAYPHTQTNAAGNGMSS
jgi:hypothetical protein